MNENQKKSVFSLPKNGGAALLKNCNFRLKTSKMKIIGSKLRSRN